MYSDDQQDGKVIEEFNPDQGTSNEPRRFEKMLETHEPKPLSQGQIVEGEIISLEENLAIVDVGAERDAIVPPEEMEEVDESFLNTLGVGDNVYVYVTRTPNGDEELLVSLEKGLRVWDWERASEYLENQEVLELNVVGKNKGGLLVKFGRLQGFVPNSHMPSLGTIHDHHERMAEKSKMIDSTVEVKVLEIDRQRKRLVLSAKEARKELRQQRLLELERLQGETITGRVSNLVYFGAFVDLGGVDGLIHISEIAWSRVEDPEEFLTLGEDVEVLIQSVDLERERISLSRKALLPSPWELFAQTHAVGDLVEGVVSKVVDFGAFAQVSEGVEGLIHVSEMHSTQDSTPQNVLFPDDTVLVRIQDIRPEQQRLMLSQRRGGYDEEVDWISRQQQDPPMPRDEEE